MTLAEFKAWFEGFTEDLTGAPTAKQWARVKSRVQEITGETISYPIYLDRYVRPYRPYWATYGSDLKTLRSSSGTWEPASAMLLAGRAEAAACRK